jgi:class 3 adenylate cyclase
MRAWTVDADDIRVAEDFDDSLLHRTPEIEAFLGPDREDKFIVIGTKGFGKTLLLKAKRILYQRAGTSQCLPNGNLLDKPIGDKIFGREQIAFFAASPLPWAKVWLAAVALTALKHSGATEGLKVNARLNALLRDRQLNSAIDHFVRLLDLSPSDLQRSATDTDGHLVPRLRTLNQPLALFIDGIDEYFNKHVEERPSNPSVTGELSPDVWYFAQLGLVEVAYQLRRINHRLKLFAAIRKEAYARLPQRTAMVQQYRGSAVDIGYAPESLREIFVNNVRLVKADRLVHAGRARSHPIEAFFGRTSVTDAYTREEEDVFGHVCRHTLLRPRDLMTVGDKLVALRPDERRNEHRMMEAVRAAADEIAHEYLAEIAPYIGELDLERLFRCLPGPVLSRLEVESLCGRDEPDGRGDPGHEPALRALHRVGLLGHVQHDIVRGEWRQRFLRPGEATLEPGSVLPLATHYLLHPVLTGTIGRSNPPYLLRIDRLNLIGYDRPWRSPASAAERLTTTASLCVLKADVAGFGALMSHGADGPVRKALGDAVQRWSPPDSVGECGAGDSVLIVCDDPVALVQTARHLMDEVFALPGQPRLRVALHHGEVHLRQRTSDLQTMIVGGSAVLCAARVEPVVEPGQVWATEEFRVQFQQRPSLWRLAPLRDGSRAERANVAKAGETEMWVQLHRLEA